MSLTETQYITLKDSIVHWERMRDNNPIEPMENPVGSYCACCKAYYNFSKYRRHRCNGCPIAEYTGYDNCIDTPWHGAFNAYANHGMDSEEFKVEAQKMINFMINILNGETK